MVAPIAHMLAAMAAAVANDGAKPDPAAYLERFPYLAPPFAGAGA